MLDFNLAKSVHQPQGWVADTPCGTSPYIAPEVLSHQRYSQVRASSQQLLLVMSGSNACMRAFLDCQVRPCARLLLLLLVSGLGVSTSRAGLDMARRAPCRPCSAAVC